jgi:hypothetical protein
MASSEMQLQKNVWPATLPARLAIQKDAYHAQTLLFFTLRNASTLAPQATSENPMFANNAHLSAQLALTSRLVSHAQQTPT